MKKLIGTAFLSALLILATPEASAAQSRWNGKVIDGQTNRPLISASLLCQGTGAGTITGEDGSFAVTCPDDTIIVSYTGYYPRKVGRPLPAGSLVIRLFPDSTRVVSDQLIVVTAPPVPIQLNVPAPLNQLHREDLQRDDGLAITPALNRVPGVYMHTGALNTNRITIRGVGNRSAFGTAKIRAYLDDIPLTSGVGETTIEDIDLSLLQGVDIWKGPAGSTYGAGLGGMLHLQTPDLDSTGPSHVGIQTTWGAFGRQRQMGQLHYYQPEKTAWTVNLNRTHSDGYRENNRYDRLGLATLGKLKTGRNQETSILLNLIDLKAFIPSSLNRDDYENTPRKAADNWAQVQGFEDNEKILLGLSHRSRLAGGQGKPELSNTTSLFTSYRNNYEVRPFNILRENSIVTGLRSRFDYRKSGDRRPPLFTAGVEAFRERYDWQTNAVTSSGGLDTLLSDNLEYRRYLNFFLEGHLRPGPRWLLHAGLNLNTTAYELSDRFIADGDLSGDFAYTPIWSPRLGVSFKPLDRTTLFATLSHGFSIPTLEETLTPEGARNPDIRPEKGWNLELGWRGVDLWDQLSFELTLYSMHISDLLVARRTALDQFIGLNAGKTRHNGLESYLSWRPPFPSGWLEFWASYTYADYSFTDFTEEQADYSGNELTGTTPHLLSAGVGFDHRGWYGHLSYQYVAAMPIDDANTVYADPYQLVNLKMGYRRRFGQRLELDLYGGVNNLLGEKYAAMVLVNARGFGGSAPRYYYPGLPRNFYGGLTMRYRW